MRRRYVAAAILSGSAALAGCTEYGAVDPYGPPRVGKATIAYTIDGEERPGACSDIGATRFELVLHLATGGFAVGSVTAPCEDFGVTMTMRIGEYGAEARLTDDDGNLVLDTVGVERFDVEPNREVFRKIDFSTDQPRAGEPLPFR